MRTFLILVLLLAIPAVPVFADFKLCNASSGNVDFRVKKDDGTLCQDWRPLAASKSKGSTGNCTIVRLTEKACIGNATPKEVNIDVDSHGREKCTFSGVKNSITGVAKVADDSDEIKCILER